MIISLIAALSKNLVIGRGQRLPWKLPDDMKFFMQTTKGHHVIMGRKNYESLPEKFRPLPGRTNIVVTRQKSYQAPNCKVVNNINDGIEIARQSSEGELFVVGGADIYRLCLPIANRLYLTEIQAEIVGDTFFPDYQKDQWKEISRKHHPEDDHHMYAFDFVVYEREV